MTFPTPRVITDLELKLKYVYNWVFEKWHKDRKKDDVIEFLSSIKVPGTASGGEEGNEPASVWDIVGPYAREHFLTLRPDI